MQQVVVPYLGVFINTFLDNLNIALSQCNFNGHMNFDKMIDIRFLKTMFARIYNEYYFDTLFRMKVSGC